MNPKISIIVPVYKVEPYIRKCIDSILAQTLTDFELILVDDGSPDNCGAICDEYAQKDNRVVVIHKNNNGVSSARNSGLDAATGEFVGFVDPDDSIETNMYEILYCSATTHNADIVVCPIKTINLINKNISISSIWKQVDYPLNNEAITTLIIPDILSKKYYSLLSSCNKLYRKEILNKLNHRFDEKKHHGEDVRFNLTLFTKIEILVFVKSPLYNYIIRKRDSLTQKFNEHLYDYILDNKNYGIFLAEKYNIRELIPNITNDFLINTLNFLQDIVCSDLGIDKKLKLISSIMNDNDFKKEIVNCQCPSLFYKLLKMLCTKKKKLCFLKVVNTKSKLKFYIDKVVANESK